MAQYSNFNVKELEDLRERSDRVFTSIINDEGTEFSVNMLKDKLTQTQRNELAEGVEFSWTIRNDYSGGKKKKKDEIVFQKKAPLSYLVIVFPLKFF